MVMSLTRLVDCFLANNGGLSVEGCTVTNAHSGLTYLLLVQVVVGVGTAGTPVGLATTIEGIAVLHQFQFLDCYGKERFRGG